jgi:hypothetical protein
MAPFINQEQAIFFDDDVVSAAGSSCTSTPPLEESSSSVLSPPARRSVTFAPDVTTHHVLHISDFTLVERRDCWYSEGDTYEIRQSWKDIVSLMENCHGDLSLLDEETRGLEGKTRDGKRIRRAARNSSITAVIDEQIYQEMDGVVDHVMIAMAYSECCFHNQKDAFERGCEDYKVARAIHELPPTEEDDTSIQNLIGPTKFDFESVRNKYEIITRDGDELITTTKNGQGSSKNAIIDLTNKNNNNFLAENFRNRFACFLPITPKRYARRVKNAAR